MDLAKQRTRWALGLATVVASMIVYGGLDHRFKNPNREHAMTAQTQEMKPFCIGRYVIDVPTNAEVALGLAKSDSSRIERIANFESDAAYLNYLAEHERTLRAGKHDSEQSLLRSVRTNGPSQATVFVSRTSANDTYLSLVETFVHVLKGTAYRVSFDPVDASVPKISDEVADIAANLGARDSNAIPTTAGACVKDGLLNRVPKEVEEFRGGARVEGPTPSWNLEIATETSGKRAPGEGLHARMDKATQFGGGAAKVLRKGLAPIDGRKGEEFVALWKENGAEVFDARLEVYGNGKPQQATIKLHFESGRPLTPDPRDPRKFLTQDEAVALWDTIVKSVRLRPNAF